MSRPVAAFARLGEWFQQVDAGGVAAEARSGTMFAGQMGELATLRA